MAEALRYNQGKPDLSFLLDFGYANEALARVFEQGAIKYERDNWKQGGKPDVEYLGSALRHLQKFKAGEVYDEDTGCHHLAHAVWNLNALLELNVCGAGPDLLPTVDPKFDQAAFEAKYRGQSGPVKRSLEAAGYEPKHPGTLRPILFGPGVHVVHTERHQGGESLRGVIVRRYVPGGTVGRDEPTRWLVWWDHWGPQNEGNRCDLVLESNLQVG